MREGLLHWFRLSPFRYSSSCQIICMHLKIPIILRWLKVILTVEYQFNICRGWQNPGLIFWCLDILKSFLVYMSVLEKFKCFYALWVILNILLFIFFYNMIACTLFEYLNLQLSFLCAFCGCWKGLFIMYVLYDQDLHCLFSGMS